MQVLARREFWRRPGERNTLAALELALSEGYGLETDVRDAAVEVVIVHDPPIDRCPTLAAVRSLARDQAVVETPEMAVRYKAPKGPLFWQG